MRDYYFYMVRCNGHVKSGLVLAFTVNGAYELVNAEGDTLCAETNKQWDDRMCCKAGTHTFGHTVEKFNKV